MRCYVLIKRVLLATGTSELRTCMYVWIRIILHYRLVACIAHGRKLVSLQLPALNDSPPLVIHPA
jgi:hypothetical protein